MLAGVPVTILLAAVDVDDSLRTVIDCVVAL